MADGDLSFSISGVDPDLWYTKASTSRESAKSPPPAEAEHYFNRVVFSTSNLPPNADILPAFTSVSDVGPAASFATAAQSALPASSSLIPGPVNLLASRLTAATETPNFPRPAWTSERALAEAGLLDTVGIMEKIYGPARRLIGGAAGVHSKTRQYQNIHKLINIFDMFSTGEVLRNYALGALARIGADPSRLRAPMMLMDIADEQLALSAGRRNAAGAQANLAGENAGIELQNDTNVARAAGINLDIAKHELNEELGARLAAVQGWQTSRQTATADAKTPWQRGGGQVRPKLTLEEVARQKRKLAEDTGLEPEHWGLDDDSWFYDNDGKLWAPVGVIQQAHGVEDAEITPSHDYVPAKKLPALPNRVSYSETVATLEQAGLVQAGQSEIRPSLIARGLELTYDITISAAAKKEADLYHLDNLFTDMSALIAFAAVNLGALGQQRTLTEGTSQQERTLITKTIGLANFELTTLRQHVREDPQLRARLLQGMEGARAIDDLAKLLPDDYSALRLTLGSDLDPAAKRSKMHQLLQRDQHALERGSTSEQQAARAALIRAWKNEGIDLVGADASDFNLEKAAASDNYEYQFVLDLFSGTPLQIPARQAHNLMEFMLGQYVTKDFATALKLAWGQPGALWSFPTISDEGISAVRALYQQFYQGLDTISARANGERGAQNNRVRNSNAAAQARFDAAAAGTELNLQQAQDMLALTTITPAMKEQFLDGMGRAGHAQNQLAALQNSRLADLEPAFAGTAAGDLTPAQLFEQVHQRPLELSDLEKFSPDVPWFALVPAEGRPAVREADGLYLPPSLLQAAIPQLAQLQPQRHQTLDTRQFTVNYDERQLAGIDDIAELRTAMDAILATEAQRAGVEGGDVAIPENRDHLTATRRQRLWEIREQIGSVDMASNPEDDGVVRIGERQRQRSNTARMLRAFNELYLAAARGEADALAYLDGRADAGDRFRVLASLAPEVKAEEALNNNALLQKTNDHLRQHPVAVDPILSNNPFADQDAKPARGDTRATNIDPAPPEASPRPVNQAGAGTAIIAWGRRFSNATTGAINSEETGTHADFLTMILGAAPNYLNHNDIDLRRNYAAELNSEVSASLDAQLNAAKRQNNAEKIALYTSLMEINRLDGQLNQRVFDNSQYALGQTSRAAVTAGERTRLLAGAGKGGYSLDAWKAEQRDLMTQLLANSSWGTPRQRAYLEKTLSDFDTTVGLGRHQTFASRNLAGGVDLYPGDIPRGAPHAPEEVDQLGQRILALRRAVKVRGDVVEQRPAPLSAYLFAGLPGEDLERVGKTYYESATGQQAPARLLAGMQAKLDSADAFDGMIKIVAETSRMIDEARAQPDQSPRWASAKNILIRGTTLDSDADVIKAGAALQQQIRYELTMLRAAHPEIIADYDRHGWAEMSAANRSVLSEGFATVALVASPKWAGEPRERVTGRELDRGMQSRMSADIAQKTVFPEEDRSMVAATNKVVNNFINDLIVDKDTTYFLTRQGQMMGIDNAQQRVADLLTRELASHKRRKLQDENASIADLQEVTGRDYSAADRVSNAAATLSADQYLARLDRQFPTVNADSLSLDFSYYQSLSDEEKEQHLKTLGATRLELPDGSHTTVAAIFTNRHRLPLNRANYLPSEGEFSLSKNGQVRIPAQVRTTLEAMARSPERAVRPDAINLETLGPEATPQISDAETAASLAAEHQLEIPAVAREANARSAELKNHFHLADIGSAAIDAKPVGTHLAGIERYSRYHQMILQNIGAARRGEETHDLLIIDRASGLTKLNPLFFQEPEGTEMAVLLRRDGSVVPLSQRSREDIEKLIVDRDGAIIKLSPDPQRGTSPFSSFFDPQRPDRGYTHEGADAKGRTGEAISFAVEQVPTAISTLSDRVSDFLIPPANAFVFTTDKAASSWYSSLAWEKGALEEMHREMYKGAPNLGNMDTIADAATAVADKALAIDAQFGIYEQQKATAQGLNIAIANVPTRLASAEAGRQATRQLRVNEVLQALPGINIISREHLARRISDGHNSALARGVQLDRQAELTASTRVPFTDKTVKDMFGAYGFVANDGQIYVLDGAVVNLDRSDLRTGLSGYDRASGDSGQFQPARLAEQAPPVPAPAVAGLGAAEKTAGQRAATAALTDDRIDYELAQHALLIAEESLQKLVHWQKSAGIASVLADIDMLEKQPEEVRVTMRKAYRAYSAGDTGALDRQLETLSAISSEAFDRLRKYFPGSAYHETASARNFGIAIPKTSSMQYFVGPATLEVFSLTNMSNLNGTRSSHHSPYLHTVRDEISNLNATKTDKLVNDAARMEMIVDAVIAANARINAHNANTLAEAQGTLGDLSTIESANRLAADQTATQEKMYQNRVTAYQNASAAYDLEAFYRLLEKDPSLLDENQRILIENGHLPQGGQWTPERDAYFTGSTLVLTPQQQEKYAGLPPLPAGATAAAARPPELVLIPPISLQEVIDPDAPAAANIDRLNHALAARELPTLDAHETDHLKWELVRSEARSTLHLLTQDAVNRMFIQRPEASDEDEFVRADRVIIPRTPVSDHVFSQRVEHAIKAYQAVGEFLDGPRTAAHRPLELALVQWENGYHRQAQQTLARLERIAPDLFDRIVPLFDTRATPDTLADISGTTTVGREPAPEIEGSGEAREFLGNVKLPPLESLPTADIDLSQPGITPPMPSGVTAPGSTGASSRGTGEVQPPPPMSQWLRGN